MFLILLATPGPASDPGRADLRIAADWAIETGNAAALADSIRLLIDAGATADPDAPFSVAAYLEKLATMEGGAGQVDALRARSARGQVDGAPRMELSLAAKEIRTMTLTMVPGEDAFVEARTANLDTGIEILLRGPDGEILVTEPIGEFGFYYEFVPETCFSIDVEISNPGSDTQRVAIFSPLSDRDTCD